MPLPNGLDRLSPRERQTLERLLKGQSYKQIARQLEISPSTVHTYTVHTYVDSLHRHFGVSTNGELMALFVDGPVGARVGRTS